MKNILEKDSRLHNYINVNDSRQVVHKNSKKSKLFLNSYMFQWAVYYIIGIIKKSDAFQNFNVKSYDCIDDIIIYYGPIEEFKGECILEDGTSIKFIVTDFLRYGTFHHVMNYKLSKFFWIKTFVIKGILCGCLEIRKCIS